MRLGVNTLFLIPGEVGGSETYLRRTLRSLVGGRPDWEIVLFVNHENEEALRGDLSRHDGVTFARLPFRASNRYSRIVREQTELVSRVRRAGIDLLWSPGYTAPIFCPSPQVTSILDMQYRSHPEDLSLLARLATDVLVRGACRGSRLLITISEFARGEIVRHTGTPREKIHVTPLAADPGFGSDIDPGAASPAVRELRRSGVPYLLVVSNTYPHKNVEAAVEAYGSIMGRFPHRFVLLGKARRGEAAVQTAAAGLADKSRFVRIDYLAGAADLAALYQGASVFLFPSLYEGFGLPVLEAMQAGVPVVTTGAGAIDEVAGVSALRFDPSDPGSFAAKIEEALSWTPAERETWVARAREHASSFTWEKTAEATARALELALET